VAVVRQAALVPEVALDWNHHANQAVDERNLQVVAAPLGASMEVVESGHQAADNGHLEASSLEADHASPGEVVANIHAAVGLLGDLVVAANTHAVEVLLDALAVVALHASPSHRPCLCLQSESGSAAVYLASLCHASGNARLGLGNENVSAHVRLCQKIENEIVHLHESGTEIVLVSAAFYSSLQAYSSTNVTFPRAR
jgi:hypothetical protein